MHLTPTAATCPCTAAEHLTASTRSPSLACGPCSRRSLHHVVRCAACCTPRRQCGAAHVVCYMLSVACCMLSVACCTLYVVCRMLSVACRPLHVVRCMLYVACCMLYVACCMLHVVRCPLHLVRCLLHVVRCMLYVARCMLHAVQVITSWVDPPPPPIPAHAYIVRTLKEVGRCHICTGTGLTCISSAPGPGTPVPHLHRD
jgi:hypothetical protein